MFSDASVLIAMMTDEEDANSMASRLELLERGLTTPVAVFETTAGVARVLALPVQDASEAVARFLRFMDVEIVFCPRT
jgi:ribonuclease VapC